MRDYATAISLNLDPYFMPVEEILRGIERRLAALEIQKQPDRPAYRKSEAARLIGVSMPYLDRFVESGELRAVKMGDNVTLIMRDDLIAFLGSLPPAVANEASAHRSRPTGGI